MAFWFWVQVAVAAFTVVSTIKQKKELKKQQKKLNKNQGVQINRFGQDEPLYKVLGKRRVGPTFVYRGTKDVDDYDDIPNERYGALMVWSIGEVNDLKELKLNDQHTDPIKIVERDWDGNIVGYYPPGYNFLTNFVYKGDPTATVQDFKSFSGDDYNFLMLVFRNGYDSNSAGWDEFTEMVDDDMSDVKFNGLTFSTLRIFLNEDNQKNYTSGEPEFTAVIEGPDVAFPTFLPNPNYGYTTNPIVHLYDYLIDTTIGKGIPFDEIDYQSFQDMRAYCDELVSTPDGDKKRFTCNYILDTSQTHQEIIDDILIGCNARLIDGDKGVRVDIDRPKTAVMHFDESDLVERIQSSIPDINDRFNEVIVRFADVENDYKEGEVSFPDRTSQLYQDWLEEDKYKELIDEIQLETVTDYYEALRAAEYRAYKSRSSMSVSLSVGAKGLQLEEGDVITVSSTLRGWDAKKFIVDGIALNNNNVGLELTEYNAAVYSYEVPGLRVPPSAPSLSNPFNIAPVTNLAITKSEGFVRASWDYNNTTFINGFRVKLKNDAGVVLYNDTISSKSYDFPSLPIDAYTVSVSAQGNHSLSTPVSVAFDVVKPATPTGLTVTDAYIEWSHPNLSDVKSFVVETTETNTGDIVAHPVAKSSNGIQRLEISGIKVGDYDVSVIAIGLNNLESNPATLTNAQIDGVTSNITPIINDAITGFAADPHTWTDLNNFTGGLQKDGVDVNNINENNLIYLGLTDKAVDSELLDGVDSSGYVKTATTQTITGDKNFTGDLLKNGSPVVGLEDLTYNSDESLAIAATTIEQFYKDQEAGLYDNFDTGVGSLAAGFVNSIINQANFLIANNANIDKLKSSAIEVSGSGYALNQNPTWQDTLDGWDFGNVSPQIIPTTSESVIVAGHKLILETNGSKEFFSKRVPVSKEETYTISVWVRQVGSGKNYLAVSFRDSSGNNITGNIESDATGWDLGTYHYHSVVNQPFPSSAWTKYEFKFGKNGDATIPTNAVACEIGMLYNRESDTLYNLQDYRIEKAMGSVSIENGSINADHLVLSGNGSITFDTVGADQAGSAATAETNAKAYAFPQANAGALATLNTISSTHIDANAVTTPKIAASQALIDKLVANYIFGTNATFAGEVYARNITGDANERGESALPNKTIPQNSYAMLFEIDLGNDPYLDRELTIESFPIEGNPDLRWRIHSTTTGGSVNHAYTSEGLFFSSPSSKGSTARITDQVKIFIPKATTVFVSVAAGRFLFTDPASTSSSDSVVIGTRALSSSLDGNITTY